jgi:hypothetical protein
VRSGAVVRKIRIRQSGQTDACAPLSTGPHRIGKGAFPHGGRDNGEVTRARLPELTAFG